MHGGEALGFTLLVFAAYRKGERLGDRAVEEGRIEAVVDADRRVPELATSTVGRVDAGVVERAAAELTEQARAAAGDVSGAEAAYRDLLRLQPWNRRALLNLGYQRLLAGDYADALRLTRAAQHQDPTYALAYENEANIYLQQGDAPAALRLLSNLEKRFPAQAPKYQALAARVRAAQ